MPKAKKRGADELSMEEFFEQESESEGETSSGETSCRENISKTSKKYLKKIDSSAGAAGHKKSLSKLKESDPEFYSFLEENDKDLLNFDVSESEDEDEDKKHELPDKLEVDSDDSEGDEDEEKDKNKDKAIITLSRVKKWENDLKINKNVKSSLANLMLAFHAAVVKASGDKNDKKQEANSTLKLDSNTAAYNAIIKANLTVVLPALASTLNLHDPGKGLQWPAKEITRAKTWHVHKLKIRRYLNSVVTYLGTLFDGTLLSAFLRYILRLVPFFTCFESCAKHLLKKLVNLWCRAEETVRVLALVAIVRLTRALPDELLDTTIKGMYLSYVKNSHFTGPSTWPMINFMRRSFVEILGLDLSTTYQHAFVYIRQLAIHLRNALTVKKKDLIKSVYNWQYIHCLYLWSSVVSTYNQSSVIRPLIYPLTQITIGAIKLMPTAQYVPLRFHCIRCLTDISGGTNTFIPVLPFILDGLQLADLKKKHAKVSFKPLDFNCALKFSKTQLTEQSFKDGVVEVVFELMLTYLNVEACTVSFPEMVIHVVSRLRAMMKECRVANYNKQLKQILEKIEETSSLIEKKRREMAVHVTNKTQIEEFEAKLKQDGTPISVYFSKYKPLRDRELTHAITNKDQMDDYNLPTVNRQQLMDKQKGSDRLKFKSLFGEEGEETMGEVNWDEDGEKDKSGKKGKSVAAKKEKAQKREPIVDRVEQPSKKLKALPATQPKPPNKGTKRYVGDDKKDVVCDFVLSDDERNISNSDDDGNEENSESDSE